MRVANNIPGPSVPLLTEDGQISQAWWQFFVTLFNRTGSGIGVDLTAVQNNINDALLNDAGGKPVDDSLRLRVSDIEAELASIPSMNASSNTVTNSTTPSLTPAGYAYVTIAGTQRKIAYY